MTILITSPLNGNGSGLAFQVSNTNAERGIDSANSANQTGQMYTQGVLSVLCAWMLQTP